MSLRVVEQGRPGSSSFSVLRNLHAGFHSGCPSVGAFSVSLASSLEVFIRSKGVLIFNRPQALLTAQLQLGCCSS